MDQLLQDHEQENQGTSNEGKPIDICVLEAAGPRSGATAGLHQSHRNKEGMGVSLEFWTSL